MSRSIPPLKLVLWLLVLAGFAFGVRSAVTRYNVERNNRRVEVTVDYAELRSMAAAQGGPMAQVLSAFKAAGVTSVALSEDTVGGLVDSRRLDVRTTGPEGDGTLLVDAGGAGPATLARVQDALKAKTRLGGVSLSSAGLAVAEPWQYVRGVGLGLDPAEVAQVQAAGLGIVGRVSNYNGVNDAGLTWVLHGLQEQGVRNVIFSGDAVLGFKGYVVDDPKDPEQGSTASALQNFGIGYGSVEFGKQKGDQALAKAAAGQTVRVHTITGAEMLSATVPGNVQRFALAARERNIRLLYVRLFTEEEDPVKFNADYVEKVVKALERGGMVTGTAHGYGPLGVGTVPKAVMGLGLAAAFVLLVDAVTGLLSGGAGRLPAAVAGLGAVACAAAPLVPSSLGVKAAAFAAAVVFPSLALLHADLLAPARRPPHGAALRRFFSACAITSLGIATVVGLLADRLFLIKVDAFAGIKLAHVLPVLLVAAVVGLGLRAAPPERPWGRVLDAARRRIATVAGQPILLWQVGAALGALVVLAVVVSRSGNDGAVGVSGLELRVRAILDRLLYARPRFKEFLIGHPALVVALLLAATGRRNWALPFFLVGALGQVSLLNTFCHLHTPLPVSLWRALLGVGIGAIIGVVAYAVLDGVALRRLSPARSEPARAEPQYPPAA